MAPSRNVVAADRLRWLPVAIGLLLAASLVVEVLVLPRFGPDVVSTAPFLLGVATTVPTAIGIAYAGYWLDAAEISDTRYPRILGWCLGGLLVFSGLNAVLAATVPAETWTDAVAWLRWAVALGAGVGLLIGVLEARAIEQAVAAERAEVRSEQLERRRDTLDYLNGVLRHEVLNSATAIQGYGTRILEETSDLDEETRRWVGIVLDEADELSRVIDDVRVLLRRTTDDHELHRVDLACVVADEVRKLRHRWPSVVVETSVPDDAEVRADDMLPRLFGNLLANAVEHNDAETPRVRIDADVGEAAVEVEVSDNGPGIPDEELDSLFERGSSHGTAHGLGLYLVDELLESYGGTVELAETGPDGTTFRVTLPRVPAEREPPADVVAV